MATPLPAAEAIRLLQEAGHLAGKRRAGQCGAGCYRVDGEAVNLRQLRDMALALPRTLDLTTGRYEIHKAA